MTDTSPLILGGGVAAFKRYTDGSTWREWVGRAATDALSDAELAPGDIDSLVVASESDFFSLQVNPGPVVAADLGLGDVPVMRAEGGGASGAVALRAAHAQIASGQARRVLVVGFEAAASHLPGEDVGLIYGLSFDADMDGMAGATAPVLYALTMAEHMARHGTTAEQMAAVSVKNHLNAKANPWAHKPMDLEIDDVLASPSVSTPYKRLDCSLLSDGAAALVLAHSDHAPKAARPRTRITATGSATDAARLGDRAERHRFAAKAAAAGRAFEVAGIKVPKSDIQVAEVYDAFTGAEIQGIEALGLAADGQAAAAVAGGEHDRDGALPVNLSGGLIGQGGAPGAVGIAQAVNMDRILGGRYWEGAAPAGTLRSGLIDCHGGLATVNVVHVLERAEP